MTDTQLYLAIGVPIVTNATMILLLHASINKRLDDMKDLWRAELHRVEEILDARLTRIEEHLHLR
jgi:hypothetical protein